jgi:hypothetical protein
MAAQRPGAMNAQIATTEILKKVVRYQSILLAKGFMLVTIVMEEVKQMKV